MTHLRFLFASAVFLASFLLFLVEPIAARQLLPSLGGSATVWITCLVFFQTALLLGYLYAHWLARRCRHPVGSPAAAHGGRRCLSDPHRVLRFESFYRASISRPQLDESTAPGVVGAR